MILLLILLTTKSKKKWLLTSIYIERPGLHFEFADEGPGPN